MRTASPHRLAALHLRGAVLYAATGMSLGYYMGTVHDFAIAPAHAHLNLLGWVSCALYGLVLRAYAERVPAALAGVHLAVAHLGAIAMPLGLAIMLTGGQGTATTLLIFGGATASLTGMLMFAVLVFRMTAVPSTATRTLPGTDMGQAAAVPAE